MRRQRLAHFSSTFGVKEQRCLWLVQQKMKHLNYTFQNCKPFRNWLNHYGEIMTRTVTKNEHIYAICCRPEIVGDVISGWNVKTVERYVVVNLEVASSSSSQDISKNHFVMAEAADIDDSIKWQRCCVSLWKLTDHENEMPPTAGRN